MRMVRQGRRVVLAAAKRPDAAVSACDLLGRMLQTIARHELAAIHDHGSDVRPKGKGESMTATQPIYLRDLLPHLGVGTLAHLDAAKLYTVEDVAARAERLRVAEFRVFLAAGLPMSRASEFVQAIYERKLKGRVA